MKKVIMDKTENTGKPFISESGENTELKENAIQFDDYVSAFEYIKSKGWENWAVIRSYEDV